MANNEGVFFHDFLSKVREVFTGINREIKNSSDYAAQQMKKVEDMKAKVASPESSKMDVAKWLTDKKNEKEKLPEGFKFKPKYTDAFIEKTLESATTDKTAKEFIDFTDKENKEALKEQLKQFYKNKDALSKLNETHKESNKVVDQANNIYSNLIARQQIVPGLNFRMGTSVSKLLERLGPLGITLAGITVGLTAYTAAMYGAIKAGDKYEDQLLDMRAKFGGFKNSLDTVLFVQKKIADGKLPFQEDDVIAGLNSLQKLGINSKKYMDTVSRTAQFSNKSFSEMSSAIEQAIHGSRTAFEDLGVTEIEMQQRFARFGGNTIAMRGAILGFLQDKKRFDETMIGGMKTMKSYTAQLKGLKDGFIRAIVGEPTDPNSLYNAVKGTFADIVGFFNKHQATIKEVGTGIGLTLKFIWHNVWGFAKEVGHQAMNVIRFITRTTGGFQETVMSVILFLEIKKRRVVEIYDFVKNKLSELAGSPVFENVGKLFGTMWDSINNMYNMTKNFITLLKTEIKPFFDVWWKKFMNGPEMKFLKGVIDSIYYVTKSVNKLTLDALNDSNVASGIRQKNSIEVQDMYDRSPKDTETLLETLAKTANRLNLDPNKDRPQIYQAAPVLRDLIINLENSGSMTPEDIAKAVREELEQVQRAEKFKNQRRGESSISKPN